MSVLLTPLVYFISALPFFLLHRISDFSYLLIYHVFGYRKKVVRENLVRSFPTLSEKEIIAIEKKFYVNFCDLIFETMKTFTLSENEIRKRCRLTDPSVIEKLGSMNVSITGISSHFGNWEWLGLSMPLHFRQTCYAIYKPLSSAYWDRTIRKTRERFGTHFIPIQRLRKIYESMKSDDRILVGLLCDQAPHDYRKAFKVHFLNQETFNVTGPAFVTQEKGFTPVWGWMKRVGRSRYEWNVEILDASGVVLAPHEEEEAARISEVHNISLKRAEDALKLTLHYTRKLEAAIHEAPEDWLWSHRRWKKR